MSQVLLAGLYARVSNIERQTGDDKVSLDVQLSEGRELAKSLGAIIVGEYIDQDRYKVGGALVDPAGWRVDRPEWLRLQADVRSGKVTLIIGWRNDRLARGLKATAQLDELIDETGVQVKLCRENFDKNMLGFSAAISRYEINVIKERTEMGRMGRVRRGLRASDKVPFGYSVVKDDNGKTTSYALKETHLPALREMARLFIGGHSYKVMCERLGVDPDNGQPWLTGKLWRTIHNPFYLGQVVYQPGGAEGQGTYPRPWDEETERRVVEESRRRASLKRFAGRSSDTMFAGILFCAICGSPMGSGGANVANSGRAYRCHRAANFNQRKSNRVEEAHESNRISQRAAIRQLKELLNAIGEDEIDALIATQSPVLPDVERSEWLTDELSQVQSSVAQLRMSLAYPLPDAARMAVATELERVQSRQAQLTNDLVQIQNQSAPNLDRVRQAMIVLASDPDGAFEGRPDEVRERLREVFQRIYVLHGELIFEKPKIAR